MDGWGKGLRGLMVRQFYPECAHLVVSGEGDKFPGMEYMAKIPGVWSMDRKSCFLPSLAQNILRMF
jgi:hypothetical protein